MPALASVPALAPGSNGSFIAADDTRDAMCGRMTQQRPTSELAEIFEAEDRIDAPGGRYNLAPTDEAAVVVQREDTRAIVPYRWGLIPHWSESANTGNRMFNARAETLDRNAAFRYAFSKRRCLIPAGSRPPLIRTLLVPRSNVVATTCTASAGPNAFQ